MMYNKLKMFPFDLDESDVKKKEKKEDFTPTATQISQYPYTVYNIYQLTSPTK